MAGIGPGDLYALEEELLDACVEALDTIPDAMPGLDGAPTRAFIAPGQPAADCCPQLTVHEIGIFEDQLGAAVPGRSYMTTRMNQVTLAVTLFRCADMSQAIPPVSELTTAAIQHSADGWALWNHLYCLLRAGLLFSECGETKWGQLAPIPPQGGCVGWVWPIEIALEGYECTPSS